jgi:hypothetical protein
VIRRLLGLAVFLLIVHAAVRAGIVWLHYQNFKDGVRETALFAGTKTDDVLRDNVMRLAAENSVPLDPEALTIDRAGGAITIRASYVDTVELLPGYRRPWEFQVVGH